MRFIWEHKNNVFFSFADFYLDIQKMFVRKIIICRTSLDDTDIKLLIFAFIIINLYYTYGLV